MPNPIGTLGDVRVQAVSYKGYSFVRIQVFPDPKSDKVVAQILLKPKGAADLARDITKALEIIGIAKVGEAVLKRFEQSPKSSGD